MTIPIKKLSNRMSIIEIFLKMRKLKKKNCADIVNKYVSGADN